MYKETARTALLEATVIYDIVALFSTFHCIENGVGIIPFDPIIGNPVQYKNSRKK